MIHELESEPPIQDSAEIIYVQSIMHLISPHHVVGKSDPWLEPLHRPEGGRVVVAIVDPVRNGVVVYHGPLLTAGDTLKLEEWDSMQRLLGEGHNVRRNSKVHHFFIRDAG